MTSMLSYLGTGVIDTVMLVGGSKDSSSLNSSKASIPNSGSITDLKNYGSLGSSPKELQQRMKVLLKEPGNKKCSECRAHKPKFMSLIKTPADQEVGVFVCSICFDYHAALGDDLCQLKSLKEPKTWTEEDITVLEKSGNLAVNAIYVAKLDGNHSEKHIGSLASSHFVKTKYQDCNFFSEDAYHQQMVLRAAGKNVTDKLSTDELLKKALSRQQGAKTEVERTSSTRSLKCEGSYTDFLYNQNDGDDDDDEDEDCASKNQSKTHGSSNSGISLNSIHGSSHSSLASSCHGSSQNLHETVHERRQRRRRGRTAALTAGTKPPSGRRDSPRRRLSSRSIVDLPIGNEDEDEDTISDRSEQLNRSSSRRISQATRTGSGNNLKGMSSSPQLRGSSHRRPGSYNNIMDLYTKDSRNAKGDDNDTVEAPGKNADWGDSQSRCSSSRRSWSWNKILDLTSIFDDPKDDSDKKAHEPISITNLDSSNPPAARTRRSRSRRPASHRSGSLNNLFDVQLALKNRNENQVEAPGTNANGSARTRRASTQRKLGATLKESNLNDLVVVSGRDRSMVSSQNDLLVAADTQAMRTRTSRSRSLRDMSALLKGDKEANLKVADPSLMLSTRHPAVLRQSSREAIKSRRRSSSNSSRLQCKIGTAVQRNSSINKGAADDRPPLRRRNTDGESTSKQTLTADSVSRPLSRKATTRENAKTKKSESRGSTTNKSNRPIERASRSPTRLRSLSPLHDVMKPSRHKTA